MVMALSVVMATAVAATGWMPRLEGAIVAYGIAGVFEKLSKARI